MHSPKPRQETSTYFALKAQHAPADSVARCERVALAALLQHHLLSTIELHGYVQSLEMRLRNVSFIDVRQLFHRLSECTEQCSSFLDARIHDLVPVSGLHSVATKVWGQTDPWYGMSFAACTDLICEHARSLNGFTAQVKGFMDRAVINGDYDSLHVMTDCVNQVSQLVALIQLHLPGQSHSGSASPLTPFNDHG
jgi:hypothetical protein